MRKLGFIVAVLQLLINFTTGFAASQKGQDELFQGRISALKTGIDINYHPTAKVYIEEYLANPDQIRTLVSRSKYYFPILEKSLKQKGLPVDLKYVAAASSMLDPLFVNPSGASGIWTMSYQVSKMYKLKVNTFVDERRDPIRSSQIAAQHFKDLFSIYKSWSLAIAAYGCSPVQLNKAIHAAGNSLYYWDIYKVMPSNCRDLYSRVIATVYILNYYKEHGIKQADPLVFPVCDTVRVNKWLSFSQIAGTMDVDTVLLRNLNPVFRKDIVPFSAQGYALRVPAEKSGRFAMLKDSFYRPSANLDIQPVAIEQSSEPVTQNKGEQRVRKKRVFYTVKRGDNLGDIADWFDVDVSELKSWNKIRGNKLTAGKRLSVFVPATKSGYYNRINRMSASQKKNLKRKD